MQEITNYTKIDRCQDNISYDNDEYYKQIFYLNYEKDNNINRKIILTNKFHLILFVFLFLISQSNALPIYQPIQTQINYNQQSLPLATVQLTNRYAYPQQTYKVYRRFPNQPQYNSIPSYSNGAPVQIYDQQHSTLQLKRERQRRAMIDRIVSLFDEDGNGQLTKDELYSMALRSNIFPKFHHYLKQT